MRIRTKGCRLSVLMKNNRLNDGTNCRTDDRPNNDWTDGWANNDWADDGTDDWTNGGTNDWTDDGTNHNRGLMVSSEFVFENALTVAIGEFKSASTAIFCF